MVFCGCSQVCVRNANCCSAYVVVEDGPNYAINGEVPECVEVSAGKIVAVVDDGTVIRNPNTACADFEDVATALDPPLDTIGRDECDEVGTAPQFGARCGEASLPDGDCDSSGPSYAD